MRTPLKHERAIPERHGVPQLYVPQTFPAPVKGLDLRQPIAMGDPQTALVAQNVIVRPSGLMLRKGYTRWVSNLGGPVSTLMPYNGGRVAFQTESKLFAAVGQNIFDVTSPLASTVAPTPALTVAPVLEEEGEWSHTNFAAGGQNYLCAVSRGPGYYTYDHTGGWVEHPAGTAAGQIDGADPQRFAYVMQWKSRLWFVPVDSTIVYYLPVGQIAGKVEPFDFGPLFPHGGSVAMIVSWTLDGGDGVDDVLVVVSSEGDLVLYKGTDPSDISTFGMAGRWYVGRTPRGRRFCGAYGGDVVIVSEHGIGFLSSLLRGEGLYFRQEQAEKIAPVIAPVITRTIENKYWEVLYFATDNVILFNEPGSNPTKRQWVYSTLADAWSTFEGYDARTMAQFESRLFFGTPDGTVENALEGETDGQVEEIAGKTLEADVQTMFIGFGDPMRLKYADLCKPVFFAPSAPAVKLQINTEWNLNPLPGAPAYTGSTAALWDQAAWDQAVWAGALNTYQAFVGVQGLGNFMSLRIKYRGPSGTIFTNWMLTGRLGGIM